MHTTIHTYQNTETEKKEFGKKNRDVYMEVGEFREQMLSVSNNAGHCKCESSSMFDDVTLINEQLICII